MTAEDTHFVKVYSETIKFWPAKVELRTGTDIIDLSDALNVAVEKSIAISEKHHQMSWAIYSALNAKALASTKSGNTTLVLADLTYESILEYFDEK